MTLTIGIQVFLPCQLGKTLFVKTKYLRVVITVLLILVGSRLSRVPVSMVFDEIRGAQLIRRPLYDLSRDKLSLRTLLRATRNVITTFGSINNNYQG